MGTAYWLVGGRCTCLFIACLLRNVYIAGARRVCVNLKIQLHISRNRWITLRVNQLDNGVKYIACCIAGTAHCSNESNVSVAYTLVTRGAGHMLSEKSQWTQNGTMFLDLN